MPDVIGVRQSRAFRVLWMLEELGEEYRHVPARPHSPEVTEFSRSGKIPVYVENGTALTDSTAIIQYLADRSGRFTYPSGTVRRAGQDGWTGMLLDEFDSCLWTAAKHTFVLPEARRMKAVKATLRWEFETSASRIAPRLRDRPFVMGAEMTVPDFILVHCLAWARVAGFKHGEPALEAYFERARSRAAYRRAEQL